MVLRYRFFRNLVDSVSVYAVYICADVMHMQ